MAVFVVQNKHKGKQVCHTCVMLLDMRYDVSSYFAAFTPSPSHFQNGGSQFTDPRKERDSPLPRHQEEASC